MTEDEAKTKWCPFSRAPAAGVSVNKTRRGMAASGTCCIASACIAWRWDGTHVSDPANPGGDMVWSNRSYGHCGLAGPAPAERADALERREARP